MRFWLLLLLFTYILMLFCWGFVFVIFCEWSHSFLLNESLWIKKVDRMKWPEEVSRVKRRAFIVQSGHWMLYTFKTNLANQLMRAPTLRCSAHWIFLSVFFIVIITACCCWCCCYLFTVSTFKQCNCEWSTRLHVFVTMYVCERMFASVWVCVFENALPFTMLTLIQLETLFETVYCCCGCWFFFLMRSRCWSFVQTHVRTSHNHI